jgi:hypothetical protein
MSIDRFIEWGDPPEWGPPTAEKLGRVAVDFLGARWTFKVEPFPSGGGSWINVISDELCSFHLASERPELAKMYDVPEGEEPYYRWMQIYFPTNGERTSVITLHQDSFMNCLANRYAKIIAKWWNGDLDETL